MLAPLALSPSHGPVPRVVFWSIGDRYPKTGETWMVQNFTQVYTYIYIIIIIVIIISYYYYYSYYYY